jgi:predicted ArsR family transcriptional regulator
VSPERYARDIELLARRGRIMDVFLSGREVTVMELAMELEMAPVNVRFVLADLLEDGLVKVDFEPEIEMWRRA